MTQRPHAVSHRLWMHGILGAFLLSFSPSTTVIPGIAAPLPAPPLFVGNQGQTGTVNILVSVIWDGTTLDDANLEALTQLRREVPSLALMHFVSPAYWMRLPKESQNEALARIKTTMRDGDEIGLHLVPWKSLAERSGVAHRLSPTFWGPELAAIDCRMDCGREVAVTSYAPEEQGKLIETSLAVFREAGFSNTRSFLAGGWLANRPLLEQARARGLKKDFSAVPTHLVAERLGSFPLLGWLKLAWPQTTALSQPEMLHLKAGQMQSIGFNGATLDYVSNESLLSQFRALSHMVRRSPSVDAYLHFGIYQETAARTAARVTTLLQDIVKLTSDEKISMTMYLEKGRSRSLAATHSDAAPMSGPSKDGSAGRVR